MTRHTVLAALMALLSALPARAAGEDAVPACPAPQAPAFAGGKGFRLWVARQGTMALTNPLRPLSPETVQVLQVVIRNKLATAYGPDLSGLRRGPAPAALEAQNGAVIQWAGNLGDLPRTLRILADDGGQVLAELAFEACGDAPKVAEQKPAPTARKGGSARKGETKGEAKAAPKAEAAQGEGAATDPAEPGRAKAAAPRPRPKREKAAAPDAGPVRTPGGLMLPQGAIP